MASTRERERENNGLGCCLTFGLALFGLQLPALLHGLYQRTNGGLMALKAVLLAELWRWRRRRWLHIGRRVVVVTLANRRRRRKDA
jgi:hypothetical protein